MTIGILSWHSPKTLENTLESYKRYDLPIYDAQRVIYFQNIGTADRTLARKYGYEAIGSEENVGIAEGYRRLVAYATGELFLFLENDWELIKRPAAMLADARYLISSNQADVVKLRDRWNPGNPLWSKQFENHEWDSPQHLLDCIHWNMTPDTSFKEISRVEVYDRSWYTTTSKNANWSNNPHMAKTQWLKDNILPHLGNFDIEKNIQEWWQQQEFRVAQGDGLFMHNRID